VRIHEGRSEEEAKEWVKEKEVENMTYEEFVEAGCFHNH